MHIEKENFNESIIKLRHDLRESKTYKNEDIDPAKKNLNYHFGNWDVYEKYKKRIDEVYIYGKNGKSKDKINYLCSVCVQYPDNCPIGEKEFFTDMANILIRRFGVENTICVQVHKDEKGKAHMHFKFMPIVKLDKPRKDGKTEKLCCADVITREMLQTFHQDIEKDFFQYYGINLSLRSQEHRKYINDIYEFKDIQNELEVLHKNCADEKQAYNKLVAEYSELLGRYNELAYNFNYVQDELQKAQEILDKIRIYFKKHETAFLPIIEEEAKKELYQLNQDIDEYVDSREL